MNKELEVAKGLECLECGTDTLDSHGIGCHTGTGRYQVVIDGGIVEHSHLEIGLYRQLVNMRETRGTLKGVEVYDNGKRLTKYQLGEMALSALNGEL